jgi:hypothetical protein
MNMKDLSVVVPFERVKRTIETAAVEKLLTNGGYPVDPPRFETFFTRGFDEKLPAALCECAFDGSFA